MTKRFRYILIGSPFAIAALIAAIVLLDRGVELLNRQKCASNLSALGQVMMLYANENKGQYPPDWGTLALTEDAMAEVFLCPNSHLSPPANLNVKEYGAWITANSDYVYLGGTLSPDNNQNVILAYEKPGHHGDCINVLFGDGHVDFISGDKASKIISQLKSHINPPHLELQGQYLGTK